MPYTNWNPGAKPSSDLLVDCSFHKRWSYAQTFLSARWRSSPVCRHLRSFEKLARIVHRKQKQENNLIRIVKFMTIWFEKHLSTLASALRAARYPTQVAWLSWRSFVLIKLQYMHIYRSVVGSIRREPTDPEDRGGASRVCLCPRCGSGPESENFLTLISVINLAP